MTDEYSFQFDKFINDIVQKEDMNRLPSTEEPAITAQREYIQKYRELPQNRIKWSK